MPLGPLFPHSRCCHVGFCVPSDEQSDEANLRGIPMRRRSMSRLRDSRHRLGRRIAGSQTAAWSVASRLYLEMKSFCAGRPVDTRVKIWWLQETGCTSPREVDRNVSRLELKKPNASDCERRKRSREWEGTGRGAVEDTIFRGLASQSRDRGLRRDVV